jgi:hypothetical protein
MPVTKKSRKVSKHIYRKKKRSRKLNKSKKRKQNTRKRKKKKKSKKMKGGQNKCHICNKNTERDTQQICDNCDPLICKFVERKSNQQPKRCINTKPKLSQVIIEQIKGKNEQILSKYILSKDIFSNPITAYYYNYCEIHRCKTLPYCKYNGKKKDEQSICEICSI